MALAAPADVGLDPALPDRLRALIGVQADDGLAQGMQVVVARHGQTVIDDVFGVVAGSDAPITRDSRFMLASASKAIAATAVHLVADRGLIAYSDPVSRHVEEFGRFGKEAVTIHQALSHQGGFPDLGMRTVAAALSGDWAGAVHAVCDLPLEYEPGSQVMYHGLTVFTILAEVVARVDGRTFPSFCQEEIFDPLGMDCTTWGLPANAPAAGLAGADGVIDDDIAVWRSPHARAAVLPSANAHSTARDLAALYLALSGTGPRRVLSPATVELATGLHAPMAAGMGFGFGLGFMVGTQPGALLSRGNLGSPRAFGHPGMTFTQAVCDPRDDLVMVFLANVASTQDASDRRFSILCDTVYRAVLERS